ncbi:universal stress protein [Dehalobacterium formicoaceticum]|uniref:Universal stress protein n=1 Tax=Dehalobacterium formicoaceticum TaxID=51515 RepID=A0ABT1Y7P9_9FIRM|nr:universal stress protein [Dehalobacterium formicoaceticum]MCR6546903.1 universal stress protein [Dehalobacterium formicoaceticum]
MLKKILVPTDGSEYSQRALLMAIDLGRQLQAEVILLHVAATPEALGYVLSKDAAVVQDQYVNSEAVLATTMKDIDLEGVQLVTKKKPGHAAQEILNEIVDQDIDLIVMGMRGYSPIAASLMGSVSQKVLTKTKKPVLLVK